MATTATGGSTRLRGVLVVVAMAVASGCGAGGSELHRGKVEIERPTTTGGSACEVLDAAERSMTEASLTAAHADQAARAATRRHLDDLGGGLPASLAGEVEAMRTAFEAAWSGTGGADPFDGPGYLEAVQAVRRFVASGCLPPG